MKRIAFLLICVIQISILMSCAQSPSTSFDKKGISFIVPGGWLITEENLDDASNLISCEKQGLNESGVFLAMWWPTKLDLMYVADLINTVLKDQIIFKASAVKFSEAEQKQFNGNESLFMDYSFSLLGIDHVGEVYCFWCEGKTVALIFQEAIEDISKNRPGFDLIKQSFQCK